MSLFVFILFLLLLLHFFNLYSLLNVFLYLLNNCLFLLLSMSYFSFILSLEIVIIILLDNASTIISDFFTLDETVSIVFLTNKFSETFMSLIFRIRIWIHFHFILHKGLLEKLTKLHAWGQKLLTFAHTFFLIKLFKQVAPWIIQLFLYTLSFLFKFNLVTSISK